MVVITLSAAVAVTLARGLAADSNGATSGRTRCQISSVMNGIIGCRARSSASSIVTSVRRVPRFCAAVASSLCSTGLVSSRYQSQNSYQVNSYSAVAARSKRYSLSAVSTRDSVSAKRETIQRSATESSAAPHEVGAAFTLDGHQYEARRVPQLVAEVAVAADAPEVEADVARRAGERRRT